MLSGCSKDSIGNKDTDDNKDTDEITASFNTPCIQWGLSKSQIEQQMSNFNLLMSLLDGENTLVYDGKDIESLISYEFKSNKLCASNVFIKKDLVSLTEISLLFNDYSKLSEFEDITYINEIKNTVAEISTIEINNKQYYCISWGDLNVSVAEAVDLGLSVKWATCNIGAVQPEERGNYYAWGETDPKEKYDWTTYIHSDGTENSCQNIGDDISGTIYDAARQEWGGSWRMPTKKEMNELWEKCTWTSTYYNNCHGYEIKGPNGNTIFLPSNDCKWQPAQDEYGGADYFSGFSENSLLNKTVHLWSSNIGYFNTTASNLFYSGGSGGNPIDINTYRAIGKGIRAVTK